MHLNSEIPGQREEPLTEKSPCRSNRLVRCPYKVQLNGEQLDEFYDVRDAMASARALKRSNPNSQVTVIDQPVGRLIIEI